MEKLKPSFKDKTLTKERTTLVENNKVVSDESELVEIFSKYFGNIIQNQGIDYLTNTSWDNDAITIRQAIEKYQNHPSIKAIRKSISTTNNFSFEMIHPECIFNPESSVNFFKFSFSNLFLKITDVFAQQNLLCYFCSLNF